MHCTNSPDGNHCKGKMVLQKTPIILLIGRCFCVLFRVLRITLSAETLPNRFAKEKLTIVPIIMADLLRYTAHGFRIGRRINAQVR